MRKLILMMILAVSLSFPAAALEVEPPEVPDFGEEYMPEDTESFGEGLWYVIKAGIKNFLPELHDASKACVTIIAVTILVSFLDQFPGISNPVIHLVSAIIIGITLLQPASTLIRLGVETVTEMTEYGKLLLPVMTGVLAAQGGVTTAGALFTTTTFFSTLLSTLIANIIVPMLYVYFCLCLVDGAVGDNLIGSLKKFLKWLITWSLKTVLYIFSGFIGITGVVSGTADASAIKAVKLTISGAVPVVGGVISEASETILVSAGIMKNAAGIYGILAILAVFVGPFLKIAVQYLLLKITTGVCGIMDNKRETALLGDFSVGMGMLLGMTGTVCLLLLISTVCFMKGVS